MLIFTVSDRVAMWSVEWIGFSIATSEMSTKSGYFGVFLKVLHMQIAAQGKSVFDVAISVQLNVVSPFSWRERPSQENQLVAPFQNHQLPAKERVTSIPKVK